jgi:hypothetical protein
MGTVFQPSLCRLTVHISSIQAKIEQRVEVSMASGRKTGGRIAGTPNKKTEELAQRLAAIGCDPVEGMAIIAMDEANPPELRGRMYAELAQYLYPKRRATEIRTDDGPRVTFELHTEPLGECQK